MDRSDWLLLAIGDCMQPIQLQKTLFKFSMESGAPPSELYEFVPYNWGPCSFQIYDDLADLRNQGLVEFTSSGRGWNEYKLSAAGVKRLAETQQGADPKLRRIMDEIRAYVTSRSFQRLLRDVYSDYPEFSTESLFRG